MEKKPPQVGATTDTPKKENGDPATGPTASFTMVETILGSVVALIIDILSAFADIIVGIGFFIQALTWLVFRFWFTIKGVKVTASLARGFIVPILVQIVPFIPTQIATFLVTVYMENHPEKFEMAEKAAGAAKGKAPVLAK